jgi:hypothetical protein
MVNVYPGSLDQSFKRLAVITGGLFPYSFQVIVKLKKKTTIPDHKALQ